MDLKTSEAPERLYISKTIYSTYLYQVPDPDDETAVEYIRVDAFIEKATLWMEENLERHISSDGEYTINYAEISRDFKTYIKNENSN